MNTSPKFAARRLGRLFGLRTAVLGLLCIACSIAAAGQSGPVCGFGLSPQNGVVGIPVTATGGCTDASSTIQTEVLDWGDGTQTQIPPPSFAAFSVQHAYATAGTFTVTLSAVDAAGAQGASSQAEVVGPNAPPTCTLSVNPTSGTAPLLVNANGNCTDPENDISSTNINWGDGTTTSGSSGSHTYTAAGNFTVTVTATDVANNTGSASQGVTVQGNQPPTCTLQVNPNNGTVPLAVAAVGNCTDPENDITSIVLNWGDGTTSNGASGTHTYTIAGKYTVTVTATDSGGLTGSASQNVNAHKTVNQPPTCVLSVAPGSGPAPLSVVANGSCTDPENDIVSTTLNWGDGSPPINGTSGNHTYTVVATYQVKLTATDSAGNVGTATQTVIVGNGHNAPPQCTIAASVTGGQVPLAVTITPRCTDQENDITSITIDFGDGFYTAVAQNANASHTYSRAGSFNAVVTATDVAGNVSTPALQTVNATDTPTMFVGMANGQLKQFDLSGNPLKTLNTNQTGSITGMAFDWLDQLYVTDFSADGVSKFDGNGTLAGSFGSGYNCKPESIAFDNSGNAYVGETGCSHALLKFDAYGNLAAVYNVATEVEGSDWIDLASDQCTIYYTSQGTTVFRFNACTGQQQAPFATGLTTGLAVKVLHDGTVLVADKADIVHFSSNGTVIGKYNAPGESCLVSLALDPDGTSFWAVDYCSSDVLRFDIASGAQLAKFNSGAPAQTTYGIGMRGPAAQINPAGPLLASPQALTVTAGQTASFAAAFMPAGPAVGQTFTFSCANLPVGASCSFTPQSSTVTSAGVSVRVTITTTAASRTSASSLFRQRWLAWWTFFCGLVFVGDIRAARGRHGKRKWIGLTLSILLLISLTACSASSKSSGGNNGNNSAPTASSSTPANNYSVIVRATSNNLQSATMVNLTVQ